MNYIPTFLNDSTDYVINKCEGHLIKTHDKSFLDLTGGLTSHAILAWNRPEIKQAILEQLEQYTHCDYKTFFDPLRETLGSQLLGALPCSQKQNFGVFFPGLSGSEGVESALKLSYQYRIENDDTRRDKFIFFEQAYHGSTLGALSMTDRPNLLQYQSLFPKNYFKLSEVNYHRKKQNISEADYSEEKILELEKLINKVGPETITAIVG